MKSLAEREAFRAKQAAENRRAGEENGTALPTSEERQKDREQKDRELKNADPFAKGGKKPAAPEGDSSAAEDKAEAAKFVDRNVELIKGDLSELTDEQLSLVEAAEKAGKKRASVYDAVAVERKARESASNSWNAGK